MIADQFLGLLGIEPGCGLQLLRHNFMLNKFMIELGLNLAAFLNLGEATAC